MFRQLLHDFAQGKPVTRVKMNRSTGVQALTRHDVWSARANSKLRMLYTQRGATLEVLAFTDRGSKEFFRYE